VVVRAPRIKMASVDTPDTVVSIESSDGEAFTVRDLKRAVACSERVSRQDSEWKGGIDVHPIYFEGIELEDDVWMIGWGS
jgi:hypothetical protein